MPGPSTTKGRVPGADAGENDRPAPPSLPPWLLAGAAPAILCGPSCRTHPAEHSGVDGLGERVDGVLRLQARQGLDDQLVARADLGRVRGGAGCWVWPRFGRPIASRRRRGRRFRAPLPRASPHRRASRCGRPAIQAHTPAAAGRRAPPAPSCASARAPAPLDPRPASPPPTRAPYRAGPCSCRPSRPRFERCPATARQTAAQRARAAAQATRLRLPARASPPQTPWRRRRPGWSVARHRESGEAEGSGGVEEAGVASECTRL
jgi:hypothetical protein